MQKFWQKIPFMEYFGLANKPLLAVDIGSSSIKVILLSKSEAGFKIEEIGSESLPLHTVVEKVIKDYEITAKILKALISRLKINTDWVICSVSGSFVIMRIIQMSNDLTETEILDEIDLDSNKYLSYPLEDIKLDYKILGPNHHHPETENDILLAAAHKDPIENLINLFKEVDLKVKIIDIDAYAFERAFLLLANQIPKNGINQTIGLIDIGAGTTSFNVFKNFERIYSREQYFGGDKLTEEIMERYGLNFIEAEHAKINGGLPDDYFIEILDPYRMTLIQNIGRFLQYFFSSEKSLEIDYLLLTGGASKLIGLDLLIQEKLFYKVYMPNPLKEFNFAKHIDKATIEKASSGFMLTVGLAMREYI